MQYRPSNKALVHEVGSLKSAALFYDEVVPFPVYVEGEFGDVLALKEDLNASLMSGPVYNFNRTFYPFFLARQCLLSGNKVGANRLRSALVSSGVDESLVDEVWAQVEDLGFLVKTWVETMSRLWPNGCDVFSTLMKPQLENSLEDADPCFVLSKMSIVDTESLSWDQIITIREDKQSLKRLRQLKTFVFEEFNNKPLSYIEDKLRVAIEEHRAAAAKHGICLTKAALSVVASEKVLMAAAAGLLTAIAGAAMPVATAIGASAALAGALIEVRAMRRTHQIEESLSSVRFLVDVQDATKTS